MEVSESSNEIHAGEDVYICLDMIDVTTGCVVKREIVPLSKAKDSIQSLSISDLQSFQILYLDRTELGVLCNSIKLRILENISGAEIKIWHSNMQPLEKSHTRRELIMMLNGEKPLSAFSEEFTEDSTDSLIPESYFTPYVQSGRFVRREVIEDIENSVVKIRRVLFAYPDQEWRIDAYLALWDLSGKVGWCEGFEKYEGYLLGYYTSS